MPGLKEQAIFGSGDVFLIGEDALITPVKMATLQDISIDISISQKQLRGQKLYAEKIGNSEGSITGKFKSGRLNPVFIEQFLSGTMSTGRELIVSGEAATIPAASVYTVVVANAANFKTDLGVYYAATGNKFEKVAAGSEAQGAYSVDPATGTYTFDATDAGVDILVSYTYTDNSGHTVKITNDLAGMANRYQIILREEDDEGEFGLKLYSCVSSKLSLATKMGDFMIPEGDFSASANAADEVGEFYFE